jgi:peptidoglycan/xylan/chitin deacetylase (PgdA/CDA1 family)
MLAPKRHHLLLLLALALPAVGQSTKDLPSGAPPIPIDATEDQIKAAVAGARAGTDLNPKMWPNGARVAVCITFDVDNESISGPLPVPYSRGEYGALAAMPRILKLADKQHIPMSFFVPAMSFILHPELVEQIQQSKRHEIGIHGWVHENLPEAKDAAQEQELLTRAIAYLTKATGVRPVGYRAPSWEFTPHTLEQIQKAGFLYDSSMMARDDPYEINSNGKATGLIELPISWILDDFPYFGQLDEGMLPDPETVYMKIYKEEFDVAYEERGLFVLTMHPHITGHRSRMVRLDQLISYMKTRRGVWFATTGEVAAYLKSQNPNLGH